MSLFEQRCEKNLKMLIQISERIPKDIFTNKPNLQKNQMDRRRSQILPKTQPYTNQIAAEVDR